MSTNQTHIVLTGAAGALGSAITHWFYEKNYELTLLDKDENGLQHLQNQFPKVNILCVDLTSESEIKHLLPSFFESLSPITTWVNNAGLIHSELFINFLNRDEPEHHFSNFQNVIQSNLDTTFLCSRFAAQYFIRKRIKGNLIQISSIAAGGNLGQTAYSAAKAGVESMTKVWAKELGRLGIRSNAIAPGFIYVPSTFHSMPEQKLNQVKKETPLGRMGKAEEIAQTIEFIIHNEFINGQIIGLDGGLTLHS